MKVLKTKMSQSFESEKYEKKHLNAKANTPIIKTIFIYNKKIKHAS